MNRFIIYTKNRMKSASFIFRSRFGGMYMDMIMKMIIVSLLGTLVAAVLSPSIRNALINAGDSLKEKINSLG